MAWRFPGFPAHDCSQRAFQLAVMENEPARQRLLRNDALSAEKKLVREVAGEKA